MSEGTTMYCGDNCNHTGPHRYRPAHSQNPDVSWRDETLHYAPVPDPRTAEERLHEDDSYGACVICREWVPHTDETFVLVPWPCAVERLRAARKVVAAARLYRDRHQDDCMCEGCQTYRAALQEVPDDPHWDLALGTRSEQEVPE